MSNKEAYAHALDFLSSQFAHKPAEHHVLIWTLNKESKLKQSKFFTEVSEAADYATKVKAPADVYFGIGTAAETPSNRERYLSEPDPKKPNGVLVQGVAGLHLDIDIQHAAHKKTNLPPSLDAAIEFVKAAPISPSRINSSGHGLHSYWRFNEYALITSLQERAELRALLEAWTRLFKFRAKQQGWDIDSVHDLARVLRVPGTYNYKETENPIEVVCVEETGGYYSRQIFVDLLTGSPEIARQLPLQNMSAQSVASHITIAKQKPAVDNFILDPNANIATEIFDSLCNNVANFKKTWEHKRRDIQDQSLSGYDMALANVAAGANLSDQDICNLLIAHRRKHNADLKLREDYYRITIGEARRAMAHLSAVNDALRVPADNNNKDRMRDAIQTALDIRIERIVKYVKDPPDYVVHFAGGKEINVKDSLSLIDQKAFRRFVFNAINKPLLTMKNDRWEMLAPKIAALIEEVELTEEATEVGQFEYWLTQYVETMQTRVSERYHRINAANGAPAILDGDVCINATELWKYIRKNFDNRVTRAEVMMLLRRIGAKRADKALRDSHGDSRTKSVYMLSEKFMPDGAVKENDKAQDTKERVIQGVPRSSDAQTVRSDGRSEKPVPNVSRPTGASIGALEPQQQSQVVTESSSEEIYPI